MFIERFLLAMLGHFFGDYWFQNDWMATNKSKPGSIGHYACTLHVLIYTITIWLFIGHMTPLLFAAIFIPHWLIDRFSVAAKWMEWKNGGHPWKLLQPGDEIKIDKLWRMAFTALVYVASDNSLHWLCLWIALKSL